MSAHNLFRVSFALAALVVNGAASAMLNCDILFSNGVQLQNVPAAKTTEEQARGLSNIQDAGNGMLFLWDTASPQIFWMKDTLVPLSIGFFSSNGTLFSIQDMEPNTEKYHYSILDVQNALELPQGKYKELDLTVGINLTKVECH